MGLFGLFGKKKKDLDKQDEVELVEISFEEMMQREQREKEIEEIKKNHARYTEEYGEDDIEEEMSYEEVINFIDNYVKDESQEAQKAQVSMQNEIAKTHRCSIHNKPILYAFVIDGFTVELSILDKCCEQSLKELISKLRS